MSIELKRVAEQALKELGEARKIVRASSSRQLAKDWDRRATDALANLRNAIQQPEPVQADSSEHLRVIASLGAALRRLSFAAQTTGGTAGPDAELQFAIGQAEQALSLGGIWQAMSATGEPVASRNPFASRCYTMSESHLSGHRLIVGFEKLGDAQDAHEWVARQGRGDFTHPAPTVPDDVVRDAERYRFILAAADDMTTSRYKSLCELLGVAITEDFDLGAAIDAAMLAAKDAP